MSKKINISIQQPCTQNFESLEKTKTGGFCQSCGKEVFDFSKMSEKDLFNYFNKSSSRICGKFNSNQLGSLNHPTPLLQNTIPKAILATAMLTIAFFSNGNAQQTIDNTKNRVEYRPTDLIPIKSKALNDSVYTLTGRILNKNNDEGLGGVTILIKKTQNGVLSDLNGNFSLNYVSKNNPIVTLQFSFIGFVTEERTVELSENQIQIEEIMMREDNVMLLGEVCIVKETKSKGFWTKLKNIFKSNEQED